MFLAPERGIYSKNACFFRALVALKLLVSFISRLVACSSRIVVDKHTDRQTEYSNPRCRGLLNDM